MVDLHKIKPRLQSPILAQVLTQYPVVIVHGARQTGNPLSDQSINEHIPALQARGVGVSY